ncbi:MAG TPA: DNA gyrase subunit A, partial [Opitutaceae bacterium]
MPKKKPAKPSDQSELPLGSSPEAQTPAAPATPEPSAPPAAATSEPVETPATAADGGAESPAQIARGKVQDDSAPLASHYKNWFLEYASYVILDRAVPHIDDGLKPVQRRILHTLWDMDDGRFHKVANVVGRTMSLHP